MTEPNPNAIDYNLVTAISSQLPTVTEEHVAMVLDALNTVTNGDPVGTILMCPQTGCVATRTANNGIHQWNVSHPDGGTTIEMVPTLPGWMVLRRPSEGATAP